MAQPSRDLGPRTDDELRRDGWRWVCRFYYGTGCEPPRNPGELAIETVHKTESSRDMEVEVGKGRPDIGKITVSPLRREYGGAMSWSRDPA